MYLLLAFLRTAFCLCLSRRGPGHFLLTTLPPDSGTWQWQPDWCWQLNVGFVHQLHQTEVGKQWNLRGNFNITDILGVWSQNLDIRKSDSSHLTVGITPNIFLHVYYSKTFSRPVQLLAMWDVRLQKWFVGTAFIPAEENSSSLVISGDLSSWTSVKANCAQGLFPVWVNILWDWLLPQGFLCHQSVFKTRQVDYLELRPKFLGHQTQDYSPQP